MRSALIRLRNASLVPVTAFHLSIYITYEGAAPQHQELTVDDVPQMINLQAPAEKDTIRAGAEKPTSTSGALAAGASEEISLDVPQPPGAKSVKEVAAHADMVVYLDGSAVVEQQARPAYEGIVAERSAAALTIQKSLEEIDSISSRPADSRTPEAAKQRIEAMDQADAALEVRRLSEDAIKSIELDLDLMTRSARQQERAGAAYLTDYVEVLRRRAAIANANAKLLSPTFVKTEAVRSAKSNRPADVPELISPGQSALTGVRWSTHPYIPRENVIQVRSNLVVADAVVRGADGAVVRGLRQDDFSISDDGKPQRIAYFSVEDGHGEASGSDEKQRISSKEEPSDKAYVRHVALVFDDLDASPAALGNSLNAAAKFISEGSMASDQFGVFSASSSVLQTFTGDRKVIAEALEKVSPHQRQATRPGSCPRIGVYQASAMQSFYLEHLPELDVALAEAAACPNSECPPNMGDQITCVQSRAQHILSMSEQNGQELLAALDLVIRSLQAVGGSRVIVLISSGFWTQSLPQQREEIIDEALRSGIAINTLDMKGINGSSEFGEADQGPPIALSGTYQAFAADYRVRDRELFDDSMAQLAAGTGGAFVHNANDLYAGLRAAAAAAEVTYVLGFVPDSKSDGKFHSLKVAVNGHAGAKTSARKGYFATQEKSASLSSAARRDELNRALRAMDSRRAIASEVSPVVSTDPDGKKSLTVGVWIGIRKLPFATRNRRRAERVIIVAGLFTPTGEFVSATEGVLTLDLNSEDEKHLGAKGVRAVLSLPASPGNYRLRVVLQEEGKGEISAFTQPVIIQ